MRESLTDILRCPACRAERTLGLDVQSSDEREVRAGALACGSCARGFEVSEGIVDLLFEPPEHIVREAAGLERFAEVMRADGWDRERIRRLPESDQEYWWGQAVSFSQIVQEVDFRPGQRVLDVGSNTCWASNGLARLGLDVVALDIARTEMQGLRTAEYFFDEVYFERVLGDMAAPPFASGSFDYVFCCEVLHHNDRDELRRTVAEAYRMLRPGGALLMLNEPLRFFLNRKADHAVEVAEFEGHEHVYYLHEYLDAVLRAGFRRPRILEPKYLQFYAGGDGTLPIDHPVGRIPYWLARYLARRFRWSRRAWLGVQLVVTGELSLNMVCRK